MMMPGGASISAASLIPVENEKDFAPPPKKLKGEEDNSSVPMSQDFDREAREAFKRWCRLFRAEKYSDQFEEEKRFNYFKDTLDRKFSPSILEYGTNIAEFADRNEQEFNDLTSYAYLVYCSVSHEILDELEEIKDSHGF